MYPDTLRDTRVVITTLQVKGILRDCCTFRGHLVLVNTFHMLCKWGEISGCLDIVCKYPMEAKKNNRRIKINQDTVIVGFKPLVEWRNMWEQKKTETKNVAGKVMRVMRMVARLKYIVQVDTLTVTHLIGSIYLSGSPGSILHIVLLHLGTNLWAGSDVACRLEGKKENGRKKQRREQGKGCSYIKTWWNSNKSVIEMNVQPLLPSTTPLVIVAEWREKTDLGLMTQEKSFMGRKKWVF